MRSIFKRLCKKPKVSSCIAGVSDEEFNQIIEKVYPVWHKIVHISNPYGGFFNNMNIRKQGPPFHSDDSIYVDSG